MKRLFFSILLLTTTLFVQAKISNHAIGLRFGGSNSTNTEISYQHAFSSLNRVELDLGIHGNNNFNAWSITGTYQWVWPIEKGFSWYAGPGAQLGTWSWKDKYTGNGDDGLWISIVGQIGIEYQFDIPLQISLDARPTIGLVNSFDNFDVPLGIAVRYTF